MKCFCQVDLKMEPLYYTSPNGAKRVWKISVEDDVIVTEFGMVGGKMSIARRQVSGKNKGKSNETTAHEQALAEAQSRWTKKSETGYAVKGKEKEKVDFMVLDGTVNQGDVLVVTSQNGPIVSTIHEEVPIFPMLALPYDETKTTFPCFVQPKLDGIRALYYRGALWSRTGKRFDLLDHIVQDLKGCDEILDGELYSHDMSFQNLCSAVKRSTDKTLKVKYVVYDIVSDDDFEVRRTKFARFQKGNVMALETKSCLTKEDVGDFLREHVSSGYEGTIIRNAKGKYRQKLRSRNLQKLKQFFDQEFKIVGYTDGAGIEAGLIIFECETDTGDVFRIRPRGTHEWRAKMFKKGKKFIGKLLTVRYQEMTTAGIPRFPVGIVVRDYE